MIHRRDGHLPFRLLADRRDGTLPADVAAEADRHLAEGCAQCRADMEAIGEIVAGIREGSLPAPPRDLDRRVAAMFAGSLPPEDPEVFVASLVFDQAMHFSPALRAGGADERRVLFAFGEHELDLAVTRAGMRYDLAGEIARRAGGRAGSGELSVLRGRRVIARTAVRDGSFACGRLPAGRVALEGECGAVRFRIPLLVLGA